MSNYRVVLADDHVIFRQGMKRLIDEMPDIEVSGEAGNGLELMKLMDEQRPDMVILDISMPKLDGIEATRKVMKRYPKIKILILTMHKRIEYMYRVFSLGAHGYLLKEDSDMELHSAVKTIRDGGRYVTHHLAGELAGHLSLIQQKKKSLISVELLTKREKEIFELIAAGESSKNIADLLFISKRTVEGHRANIMQKLKVKNVADLVRYAVHKRFGVKA